MPSGIFLLSPHVAAGIGPVEQDAPHELVSRIVAGVGLHALVYQATDDGVDGCRPDCKGAAGSAV